MTHNYIEYIAAVALAAAVAAGLVSARVEAPMSPLGSMARSAW